MGPNGVDQNSNSTTNTRVNSGRRSPGSKTSNKLKNILGKAKADSVQISDEAKQKAKGALKNITKGVTKGAKEILKAPLSALKGAPTSVTPIPSPLNLLKGGGSKDDEKDQSIVAADGKKEDSGKKEDPLKGNQAGGVEKNEAKKIAKAIKKKGHIRKPAIFFIGGLETFSGGYGGIKKMAESVPGARYYSWDQKDEMIAEIDKRHVSQPVVLVGHSYGGDTAFEMAEELNTLDHNFRQVNLMVTLDSVGGENDIIPQNVRKNLNFFGEGNPLLNDGPHVARNNQLSDVINELRSEGHTELDDTKEIQYKILKEINLQL
ncbi:MAG: hypothetical protein HOE90_00405 [Bacteriovoracaceae bacterium]|jgi:hypothetical protein|nr:hypothetical protein [Bacteriovoracaceae bacterium]